MNRQHPLSYPPSLNRVLLPRPSLITHFVMTTIFHSGDKVRLGFGAVWSALRCRHMSPGRYYEGSDYCQLPPP